MKTTFSKEGVNALLDAVISLLHLKNDAALSRQLDLSPTIICNLRHGRLPIGPTVIIRIHEETGWEVKYIKEILAQRQREAVDNCH